MQRRRAVRRLWFDRSSVSFLARRVVFQETTQRFPREVLLTLEITRDNQVLLGMLRQPTLAPLQELLDLVLRHPVVLLVVENWDERIEVGQEILQSNRPGNSQRHIGGFTPLRELVVQRRSLDRDCVAQRFEEPAD